MATSPLYDIYDPDGELRRLAELRAMRENPLAPYRESLSDLMPEEQKSSLLSKLSNVGASGVGALGWLLDTPGAIIRGGLSGGLGKAASALVESSDERVTGRELLRQYGLVGEEDNWTNWTLGFAAEAGLDPFTYLNPLSLLGRGAYTNAGKALARSGVLEDAALLANKQGTGIRQYLRRNTADDILSQYEREFGRNLRPEFEDAAAAIGIDATDSLSKKAAGAVEFRVPGMKRGYTFSGGAIGDAAASFLDTAGEAAKRAPVVAPLANRTTRFFDTSVMGALDPDSQWRNREAFARTRNAQRDVRDSYARLQFDARTADTTHLPDELKSFDSQRIQNALADLSEAAGDTSKVIDQEAVRAIFNTPAWKAVADEFSNSIQKAVTDAKQRGVKLRTWDGESSFFPSQKRWFDTEAPPDIPAGRVTKRQQQYTSGQRALNLEDNLGRSRDPAYDLPMRRQALRQLMAGQAGRDLQNQLLQAPGDPDAVRILEQAWQGLDQSTGGKMGRMYGGAEDAIQRTQQRIQAITQKAQKQGLSVKDQNDLTRRLRKLNKRLQKQQDNLAGYKVKLVDQLRMADTQFADKGLGLFDNSAFEDMLRYDLGRAKVTANADAVIDNLARIATQGSPDAVVGGGGITLTQAGQRLGFVPKQFKQAMQAKHGIDADQFLVTERQLEDLKQLLPQGPQSSDSPLSRLYRSFTNAFKIGALANPAYHFRNLYSGQYATMSQGIANPFTIGSNALAGFRAGSGNYDMLLSRVKNIPRYKRVADAQRALGASEDAINQAVLREFQGDFARNRLGQGQVVGDIEGAAEAPGLYLGAGAKTTPYFGKDGLLYDPNRSFSDLATVRGVDFTGALLGKDRRAPQVTKNPLLQLHERTSQAVEDANRMGTYLSALQRGASPDEAARLVYQSQIDYSPEAFTAGEQALKRLVPFYSYPRGIMPLIANNVLYRPGGLQGQTIRAVTSGGRGSEDFFVPEYLRQEAAVPIPWFDEESNLQRFVTNLDLPFNVLDKFSVGTGNTYTQAFLDTLKKTGVNLAGDLNPLPKYAIENLFGKQLYSGRDLADLYSVLEQDLGPSGRTLEQFAINLVPGASKLIPMYRTLKDDRLTDSDKLTKLAVNSLLGFKFRDIDQDRTREQAARAALERRLQDTAEASTYQNINVPEDKLATMGERERELYLLYRVLQSEASQRARKRKQAEAMQDPLAVLGIA